MSERSQLDEVMMLRALELAAKGRPTTTPNPCVGCVIVNMAGDVVGEGFHEYAGGPHAEVNAIADADGNTQGATAYVTLEPCNHTGRTGPCSQALIDAGIQRVVYAMLDPNPQVAGAGVERLRAAGITVSGPLCSEKAEQLNPGFLKRMRTKRPYVRCKLAMSLDGRTAMASGESQWITGPEAREDVQKLRAESCAIITGVESVIKDNPSLTVRTTAYGPSPRQPLRVIVDSTLRTPLSSKMLSEGDDVLIATCTHADSSDYPKERVKVEILPEEDKRVCLDSLLSLLAERQCNEILVETGAKLAGVFLQQGLIDELVIYMAGKIMGSTARPLVDLPLVSMADALAVSIESITPVGDDWKIIARPSR